MAKMHYFSNKFSKIARCWGLSAPSESPQHLAPPASLNLQYWWPEVPWFVQ